MLKNKIIASLLAGVFIASGVFYSPILKLFQYNIKSEMQGLIKTEKAEISVLDLTKAEFNKIKWLDANEFILDNVLYDLVSSSKTSKGFLLKVVSDKKETNVLERMKEEHSKKCLGELFQIISQYSNDVTSLSFSRIPDQVKFNLEAPIHYLSLIAEQDSPPPKLMF